MALKTTCDRIAAVEQTAGQEIFLRLEAVRRGAADKRPCA
jgi:hypothetical protein